MAYLVRNSRQQLEYFMSFEKYQHTGRSNEMVRW